MGQLAVPGVQDSTHTLSPTVTQPAVLSSQYLVAQDSVSTLRHIHYSLSMMRKATVSSSQMI